VQDDKHSQPSDELLSAARREAWTMTHSTHTVKIKGKGKFRPVGCHEGTEAEHTFCSSLSLTSALDGVGG
jgi:hypothetical protein